MDYYQIEGERLGWGARVPLKCLGDSGEVFYEMALDMIAEIKRNNAARRRTALILPVGPVGQYPIFTRLVNEQRLSLKNCWFLNMDEYLNDDQTYIDIEHPLSFRGFMQREVYGAIDEALLMPPEQRVFPDPERPERTDEFIGKLGGVDIAFGGIGINGHLAFNEPDEALSVEEFSRLPTRALAISRETRTINAVGDLGGAIESMPRYAVTLGMKQILSARKIRLGVFRDWHRAVVRRAAYGDITSAFPATLIQRHPDAMIYLNANAAKRPY